MTKFSKDLMIFLVFLIIVFRSCANIEDFPEERTTYFDGDDIEFDFFRVGFENDVHNSLASSDQEAELPRHNHAVFSGSYGNISQVTSTEGGKMFDSIFSDRLGASFDKEFKNCFSEEDFEVVDRELVKGGEINEDNEKYDKGFSVKDSNVHEDCFKGKSIRHVSMEWIKKSFIPYTQSGNMLSAKSLREILEIAEELFLKESFIMTITRMDNQELIVVGEIHGQFDDLVRIFEQNGYPTAQRKFIFNGDIIDRGPNSIGCLMTLFLMKTCLPKSVFVTRGNHESHTCGDGTFREECFERIQESPFNFFSKCHEVFNALPFGYIIQKRYFVRKMIHYSIILIF
mgnify:CR=1 FL=1